MAAPDSDNNFSAMSTAKPTVIGLYGIPGSGKSTLLRDLKQRLGETKFCFHEGSEVIASLFPGGLAEFQQAPEDEKTRWRRTAVECIGTGSAATGRAAVVTGHFMFWPEGDETGDAVYTQSDLDTYTHVIYLDTSPVTVSVWCQLDHLRARRPASAQHLHRWQGVEKTELRRLCRDNGILFTSVSYPATALETIAAMLLDFSQHTEAHNLCCAKKQLDEIIGGHHNREKLQTALVLDADKTLAADDTGVLFWETVAKSASRQTGSARDDSDRSLKTLFGSPLGYTYTAFRQAMLLYEEETGHDEFNALCEKVASSVTMHPEMLSLLRHAGQRDHVAVVVVTCGLRRIWEIVLTKAGLSEAVKVVGGGRISDGLVVTAEVKGALAVRMRDVYGLYVLAIGDSPLDLPMMREAHQALVVVGEKRSRSKTMDAALLGAIDNGGLRVSQVLLPRNSTPRLDPDKLPPVQLDDREFLDAVVQDRDIHDRIFHATGRSAAKLLMTPTRDSRVFGPALREAHRRVGWYLATEFLADVVEVEGYSIPHVQGHTTDGHRVGHEDKTPDEVMPRHIKGKWTVILVDSVVNSGKSVVEFVERVRSFDPTISIVVVAGVVQSQSLSPAASLGRVLEADRALSLVALRLSENKFQGRGGTDTGNRLFNTTQFN
ncbi:hypothetical protein C8A00DRAFT_35024 [Chaetomidium leptoderma]|uniref:Phosphoribosyltransferase domain-containing protein n=1 Tax=Chaetomidium leptoderma TaxID=669021 RepID=A0AAN6VL79_9PEZI|nr:hypothetical protein C8A00DRAFT_35024 [Chaetomidium leptoderma]